MQGIAAVRLLLVFAIALSLASLPGLSSNAIFLPSLNTVRANPAPATSWIPAGPSINTEIDSVFSGGEGSSVAELSALESMQIDMTDTPLTPSLVACLNAGIGCPSGVNPANFYVTAPDSSAQQFGYLSTWNRAVNNVNLGLPNYFAWLDTYNTNYASLTSVGPDPNGQTLIQGFGGTAPSLNPFVAVTFSGGSNAAIPTPLEGYGAAAVGGIFYYVAGYDGTDTTLNEAYNAGTNSWAFQAPLPGAARAETVAVSDGTYVYLIGGRPVSTVGNDLLRYDPATNTWASLAPMPTARATEHMAVYSGGNIYVMGGRTSNAPDNGGVVPTLEIYNIAGNSWSTGAPMPQARSDSYAVLFGTKIYLFDGVDASGAVVSSTFIYDIPSNTWVAGAASPVSRVDPAAGVCGSLIYVMGGADSTFTLQSTNYAYDPATNSWTASVSMPIPTAEVETNTVPGTIYVVSGGIFGSGASNPVNQSFNCGKGVWTGSGGTVNSPPSNLLQKIYDHLLAVDPVNNASIIDWMSTGHTVPCNSSVGVSCSAATLGYTPPGNTMATVRFALRSDDFWQSDSSGSHPMAPVTSWDVRYSFLSFRARGSPEAAGLGALIDVHVLSRFLFDVNLGSLDQFTLRAVGGVIIIPGRYWSATCSGATWDSDLSAGSVPDTCMSVSTTMGSRSFDPIASMPDNGQSAGILIGSGPFECQSIAGIVGSGCSSNGLQNPPAGGSYVMTRFGCNRATGVCNLPGTSPTSTYFRSDGTLASYIWSGNNGGSSHDTVLVSEAAFCFGKPVGTPGCVQWQHGIGNPGPGLPVGITQLSIIVRFLQDGNWVAPFNWLPGITLGCCPFTSNPPPGIDIPTPVLYEGKVQLNPCSVDPVNGYDC